MTTYFMVSKFEYDQSFCEVYFAEGADEVDLADRFFRAVDAEGNAELIAIFQSYMWIAHDPYPFSMAVRNYGCCGSKTMAVIGEEATLKLLGSKPDAVYKRRFAEAFGKPWGDGLEEVNKLVGNVKQAVDTLPPAARDVLRGMLGEILIDAAHDKLAQAIEEARQGQ